MVQFNQTRGKSRAQTPHAPAAVSQRPYDKKNDLIGGHGSAAWRTSQIANERQRVTVPDDHTARAETARRTRHERLRALATGSGIATREPPAVRQGAASVNPGSGFSLEERQRRRRQNQLIDRAGFFDAVPLDIIDADFTNDSQYFIVFDELGNRVPAHEVGDFGD